MAGGVRAKHIEHAGDKCSHSLRKIPKLARPGVVESYAQGRSKAGRVLREGEASCGGTHGVSVRFVWSRHLISGTKPLCM